MNRRRRLLAAVAALASVPLLLSGCFLPPGGVGDHTSTPTDETVDAALEPYYKQIVEWKDCDGGFQCATVIAPMDWANPSEETDIELALIRRPASGTAQGSLFMNPGGPGASGVDFVRDGLDFAYDQRLADNFDIIGWDPRGVGQSTPVTCYDDPELDQFIYGLPEAPTGTQEWVDEVVQASIDFGQACLQNTGEVLQFIDTRSTVHDLDMMRAIVGDEKLNYFGYSYGSDIGSIYVDEFPEKTGR
ncbi:MAG TPA: alpha/beta fold hydrolase, partial [Rhodoglobus sp.]|nr:alpha/beta fold hydrolase [Rhodoglobus sp.]